MAAMRPSGSGHAAASRHARSNGAASHRRHHRSSARPQAAGPIHQRVCMKLITAVIRPFKLDEVREALAQAGVSASP
jgi:hypothetical protein